MGRRSRDNAAAASEAASEAARVLQQRGQEARSAEKTESPAGESPTNRAEIKTITVRNEPRRRAMEEIEQRDLQTKALDMPGIQAEPEPAKEAKAEDPAAPKQEEKPAHQEEPVAAVPEAPAAAPEAPKTVRVKVDGEEFDAPADEVESYGGVKAYQMHKASERRLQKANEALAETRRVQQAILEAAMRSQQPASPQQPKVTDDQFIASKLDEIRFGTPEQGAAALQEVLQRATKQVDPNAIIDQAVNKMRHDQAVAAFDREFTDIAANPMLLKLVVTLRNERLPIALSKGPVDFDSFYRTIGNEVRSVAGRPSQSATAPAAQSAPATSGNTSLAPSEKEARKASIVNLPTAAARAELPKDSKPETRDDVLAQMRKSRGLPTG